MSGMSLTGMASLLMHINHGLEHGSKEAVTKAAELCVQRAKSAIGTYEYGWPPLDPATVARKGADTPLLQTGELQGSIEYTVTGPNTAVVGTNDHKAEWLELGTSKMPPRSFIAETGRRCEAEVHALVGASIGKLLKGGGG